MIACYIDGKVAYPDTSSKIKVTYCNQYIEDSGSYTYQITFPMAVAANKIVFGNVDRFNVRKSLPDYEECRLLVDNRLIVSGKGTVTAITNETVKLQIVGGKSRIKYNSKMTSHYIDEIDYPEVQIEFFDVDKQILLFKFALSNCMKIDLSTTSVVGEKGKYAFNPTYDETNDIIANRIWVPFIKDTGVEPGNAYMYNAAVQPYLLYVLRHALEHEGYTITQNDYDVEPWNQLVICNARKTTKIKYALPHWSVYDFIEEVRKLFGASFIFDEVGKSVRIVDMNELTENERCHYDCEDEFSVEYQEDAIKSITTSNLEYDWPDSANREYTDYIPAGVLKAFDIVECDSIDTIPYEESDGWTRKKLLTTIFKVAGLYYVFIKQEDDDGNYTGKKLTPCGFFNALIRDEDSEDYETFKIVPVARTYMPWWTDEDNIILKNFDYVHAFRGDNLKWAMPSVANDKEASVDNMTIDEDGEEYYVSVQDALQDSSMVDESDDESDDEQMQVMFQSEWVWNMHVGAGGLQVPSSENVPDDYFMRFPIVYTDSRNPMDSARNEIGSLSLEKIPRTVSIGNYVSTAKIDGHNQICIKFVTDEIPDPSKIYVFRGKRYICQKIEMNVDAKGVDKEKTGYFYEMLG